MTDRPIIFSGSMVRALLAGRKTQTRRLATSPLRKCEPGDRLYVRENYRVSPDACEAWDPRHEPCKGWIDYAAGGCQEVDAPDFAAVLKVLPKNVDWDCLPHSWRPSIHMPRWASRLTLIVEAVRVEPVQEISEADAIAEGVEPPTTEREDHDRSICSECGGTGLHGALGSNLGYMEVDCTACDTHLKRYRHLWSSLHGAASWDANPDVVAITFSVERGNIDRSAA